MKACTYASVMQCVLMLAGVIVVIAKVDRFCTNHKDRYHNPITVQGMFDLGGWSMVWEYGKQGNRTQLYE
jgi:hypothetical protein